MSPLPKFIRNTISFIYNNFEYREIQYDGFEINMDEDSKKSFKIITNCDFIDDYNFADLDTIIIDGIYVDEIEIRKIIKVKFLKYREVFESKKNFSKIVIKFKIIDFEIQQDNSIQSLFSLVRELKIDKLSD